MSIIKNGQISLYFHFNKIMKIPETSFQSPALNQKMFEMFEMFEMFVIQHTSIWPNFIFIVLRIRKKSISVISIM